MYNWSVFKVGGSTLRCPLNASVLNLILFSFLFAWPCAREEGCGRSCVPSTCNAPELSRASGEAPDKSAFCNSRGRNRKTTECNFSCTIGLQRLPTRNFFFFFSVKEMERNQAQSCHEATTTCAGDSSAVCPQIPC